MTSGPCAACAWVGTSWNSRSRTSRRPWRAVVGAAPQPAATAAAAGTHGSATSIKYRLRTNGPNFNNRKEQYEQVLYAIRNGGFSGAIMPQNLAVGQDAVDLAKFVSRYAGAKAKSPPGPSGSPP